MTAPATLRTPDALADAGLIAPDAVAALRPVAARYAVAISPAMLTAMAGVTESEPLERQFVPDLRELDADPAESADPIGDAAHSPVPGIVHRYPDRVLLTPTHACPVYCRFCFRREAVGPGGPSILSPEAMATALDYVRARPQIREVILTGGDPLGLSERRIAALTAAIGDIVHVETIRWHSRVPVVAPERVTPAFVEALRHPRCAVVIALHVNHPAEFTPEADIGLARLRAAGVVLLSQSVLLAGVNDDAATLEALMRAFVARGVRPYYLHHPDMAPGTAHFRRTVAEGQAIFATLRRRLPADALPRYVLDTGTAKVDLAEDRVRRRPDGVVELLEREVWRPVAQR